MSDEELALLISFERLVWLITTDEFDELPEGTDIPWQ